MADRTLFVRPALMSYNRTRRSSRQSSPTTSSFPKVLGNTLRPQQKALGIPPWTTRTSTRFTCLCRHRPEQQRIAAYLDASCAAIDAAVAAKRRQLETLDALRKTIHQRVGNAWPCRTRSACTDRQRMDGERPTRMGANMCLKQSRGSDRHHTGQNKCKVR